METERVAIGWNLKNDILLFKFDHKTKRVGVMRSAGLFRLNSQEEFGRFQGLQRLETYLMENYDFRGQQTFFYYLQVLLRKAGIKFNVLGNKIKFRDNDYKKITLATNQSSWQKVLSKYIDT